MNNNKLLLGFFAAILITSGCMETSGDSEATTTPVSVNDFSITPNPAPGGQTVNVQMELENAGGQDVNGVTARLFGPTFASSESQQRTWRTSDGGGVDSSYRTMDFNELTPATDTSPAVPSRDTITFTAPSLNQGRINSYNFNARIQYRSQTTADTEIQVMSDERYQETETSQTSPSVENSDGPIQIDVQGTTPHVFYDVGTADEEMCFTVSNQGEGSPFLVTGDQGVSKTDSGYEVTTEAEDKVKLTVEDVGNVNFESQENGENSVNVELIGNEGYHCYDMTLSGLGQITDLEQTTDIPIEVEYGYQEETSTSVTVEGRRDTGDSSDDSESGESSNSDNTDSTGYDWTGSDTALSSQRTVVSEDTGTENPSVNEVCEWLSENNEEGYDENCEQ